MIQDDHHYRYNPQRFDMKLFIHTVLLYFHAKFTISVIVISRSLRRRNQIFSIKSSNNCIRKCFRIFDDRHMHQWPLLRICRTQICFFNGIIPQDSFLGFHLFLKICCLTACNITAGAVK